MTVYQPGKSIHQLCDNTENKIITKLNSNELPYPHASSITQQFLKSTHTLSYYPDDNAIALRTKIATINHVNIENVAITAGSSEAIALAISAFTKENHEVIGSTHAFQLYKICTKQQNRHFIAIDETSQWSQDLTGILKAISSKTQLIFITNPSNPLGTWVKHSLLTKFLQNVPKHITIVIDEAYFEFMSEQNDYQSASCLINRFSNILITRTFSKLYGLASLRIGYTLGCESALHKLCEKKLPFSINSCAINCALQVLNETKHYEACKNKIINSRRLLYNKLAQLNYTPLANSGNFLTFHVGPKAASLVDALENYSIFIRGLANYSLPEHVRVSIGTNQQINFFIKYFQQEASQMN